jgi:hypothetical protein
MEKIDRLSWEGSADYIDGVFNDCSGDGYERKEPAGADDVDDAFSASSG